MNESIENVSGEINDEESQKKSQGSHRQPKSKNPDVNVLTVDGDGNVMSPAQSGRNSNLSKRPGEIDDVVHPLRKESDSLNFSPVKGVVMTTQAMGGSSR